MNLQTKRNAQYSVTGITDANGELVQTYNYTPYGKTEVSQPYGYTGRRLDTETGLYYFRARYYSPEMGRFVSKDPIMYKGSPWNRRLGNYLFNRF